MRITTSTRRFLWRPASSSLPATGLRSPPAEARTPLSRGRDGDEEEEEDRGEEDGEEGEGLGAARAQGFDEARARTEEGRREDKHGEPLIVFTDGFASIGFDRSDGKEQDHLLKQVVVERSEKLGEIHPPETEIFVERRKILNINDAVRGRRLFVDRFRGKFW